MPTPETKRDKTAGELSKEMAAKPSEKIDLRDLAREVNKDYLDQCQECVKNHSHLSDPWYIVVLLRKEPLLPNVMQRVFLGRETLPTPQSDQTVWRYDPRTGDMQLIWMLPHKNLIPRFASMGQNARRQDVPKVFWCQRYVKGDLHQVYYRKIYGKDEPLDDLETVTPEQVEREVAEGIAEI